MGELGGLLWDLFAFWFWDFFLIYFFFANLHSLTYLMYLALLQ